jgi:hypothetical protein
MSDLVVNSLWLKKAETCSVVVINTRSKKEVRLTDNTFELISWVCLKTFQIANDIGRRMLLHFVSFDDILSIILT